MNELGDRCVEFDDGNHVYSANIVHVMDPTICAVCRIPLLDQLAVAVGEPYYAMVHKGCLPMFNPAVPWQHQHAAVFYVNRTTERWTPSASYPGQYQSLQTVIGSLGGAESANVSENQL